MKPTNVWHQCEKVDVKEGKNKIYAIFHAYTKHITVSSTNKADL